MDISSLLKFVYLQALKKNRSEKSQFPPFISEIIP